MALLKVTAHRIDREPVLFLGCTGTEIFVLVILGALAGALIGLVIAIITSWWFVILPTLFLGAFLGVYKGGKVFQQKKEGKPEGYYTRFILAALSDRGWLKVFIMRSGFWSLRR